MASTELWLVRHGESIANLAAGAAEAAGADVIDTPFRDADVPLSDLGQRQAAALGDWIAARELPPDAVWASSYLRAQQTAAIALAEAHLATPIRVDERLRDRELGVFDGLTIAGITRRYPEEAERLQRLGKFYHRPPGGESWVDVIARVRDYLRDVDSSGAQRALITAHDVVVLQFIYVCLGLTERQVLDFATANTVANASVTVLRRESLVEPWVMITFADDSHL